MVTTYRIVHPAIDVARRIHTMPQGVARGGHAINVMHALTTPITRRNAEIRDKLAPMTQPLDITAYCRLFDVTGSSNDLPQWQVIFNRFKEEMDYGNLYGAWGRGLPTLSACCSNIPVSFKFSATPAGKEQSIIYTNPTYGIDHLEWDFSKNPLVPIGNMQNAAFKVLGDVYGLRGIEIEAIPAGAVARSGGLEGSNAFMYAMQWAGATLAGTGHGPGELFSRSVNDSNYTFSDLTGGQGISAMIEGGYHTFRYIVGPGMLGYISSETIPPSAYGEVESHIDLVQPGKDFAGSTKRSAADINGVWCNANNTVDGFALNSQIPELGIDFAQALNDAAVNKNEEAWKHVVDIARKQANDIRAKLCSDYFLGNEEFVREVNEMGGAAFALGAGGPETMFAVLGPKGLTQAVRERFDLQPITDDVAQNVLATKGLLRGYVPYKINEVGMTHSEGWEQFGPIPPAPVEVEI